jgi:hypothetical protein
MALHIAPELLHCLPVCVLGRRVVVQVDWHMAHANTDIGLSAPVVFLVDVGVEWVDAVDQPPSNVHVEWASLQQVEWM